jgi:DNA-binding HxlR family transcriptional regulator
MLRSKKPVASRSGCPLNAALEAFGDPWSLLVVRDLMFGRRHTFADFMQGGEGIATNILADRLRRLEKAEIILRKSHPSDKRRQVYELTGKGFDLAPVLVEMIIWGDRYYQTGAPPALIRRMKEKRAEYIDELRASFGGETNGVRRETR